LVAGCANGVSQYDASSGAQHSLNRADRLGGFYHRRR
jgi:hypothetical protein